MACHGHFCFTEVTESTAAGEAGETPETRGDVAMPAATPATTATMDAEGGAATAEGLPSSGNAGATHDLQLPHHFKRRIQEKHHNKNAD